MPWILCLAAVLAQGAAARPGQTPEILPPTPWSAYQAPFDSVATVSFVAVAEVNLETARAWKVGLEWPTSAFEVARRAVDLSGEGQIQIRTQKSGEAARTVWISFIQYGFRDDSVYGQRDDLELLLQLDGTYRVRAHERSHACYRGPATGVWIAEPCL